MLVKISISKYSVCILILDILKQIFNNQISSEHINENTIKYHRKPIKKNYIVTLTISIWKTLPLYQITYTSCLPRVSKFKNIGQRSSWFTVKIKPFQIFSVIGLYYNKRVDNYQAILNCVIEIDKGTFPTSPYRCAR